MFKGINSLTFQLFSYKGCSRKNLNFFSHSLYVSYMNSSVVVLLFIAWINAQWSCLTFQNKIDFNYFWPRTVSTFDNISIYVRKYDFKTPWNILEPSRSAFYMSRKRGYARSFCIQNSLWGIHGYWEKGKTVLYIKL